jgi:hypothetical protein
MNAAPSMNATVAVNASAASQEPMPSVPESATATPRRSFGDYLSAAREAWTPDVVVTPAWVRQVTGCSRGLSSRLAATLRADVAVNGTEAGA